MGDVQHDKHACKWICLSLLAHLTVALLAARPWLMSSLQAIPPSLRTPQCPVPNSFQTFFNVIAFFCIKPWVITRQYTQTQPHRQGTPLPNPASTDDSLISLWRAHRCVSKQFGCSGGDCLLSRCLWWRFNISYTDPGYTVQFNSTRHAVFGNQRTKELTRTIVERILTGR